MTERTLDLIAVGGGTAGLVTAAGGAGLGARVALVERDRLGGECLWNGCVPSKALIAASRAVHAARTAARLGIHPSDIRVAFDEVLDHVRRVQARIAPHDSPERFRGLGVHVVEGSARFVDAHTIQVGEERLTARHIVIATGTRPTVPPIPGLSDVPHHTNETIFSMDTLPGTLMVVGGGPIGIELAQAFARLGSIVYVIEASPDFFAREDRELADMLQRQLEGEGVRLMLNANVTAVRRDGDDIVLAVTRDGVPHDVRGDALLIAVGRTPNVEGLGLDAIGVRTDKGGVITDGALRTNVNGVYAAGDIVSGGLKFTHVADHMARSVLRNALFPGSSTVNYSGVPWVTYTDPELAHVGLTEAEARDRYGSAVGVWRRELAGVDRVIADAGPAGLVKIITDPKGRVVGGHILGAHAGDMIGELTMAVTLKLTVGQIASVIHPYPTTAEAIRQASEQRRKAGFTGWKKSLVSWLVQHV
ncbi:dihydrolipoyl dehydrogenase family protein [Gemmatimonas sp.]|uniref:dihydrolipoyl dehydrogenase family protein n=1 Tax=Gemmatimonas sp. TaxID=1962908 RepID=UPI00398310D3